MPVIVFEGEELDSEKKTALIRNLTETAADVTGIPPRFFSVVLHEQPSDNLGFGGQTVTEIKAAH